MWFDIDLMFVRLRGPESGRGSDQVAKNTRKTVNQLRLNNRLHLHTMAPCSTLFMIFVVLGEVYLLELFISKHQPGAVICVQLSEL